MTLQEHYNAIKSGKGNKDQFLKQARYLFPEYVNQYSSFDSATNVLKSKQIISEAAGGVVSKGFDIFDWRKILEEEAKASEKQTSKEVTDKQAHAYDNKDMKNADNINFNEIMKGFYCELRDEKNNGKTGDELKDIVVKNLAKDPLYYTKNGMFGEKGVGYTDEAPGLGTNTQPTSKEATVLGGNDKVDSDSDVVKNSLVGSAKKNVKDTLSDSESKDSMPKKVKEMPDKGVTGTEKKIKLKEEEIKWERQSLNENVYVDLASAVAALGGATAISAEVKQKLKAAKEKGKDELTKLVNQLKGAKKKSLDKDASSVEEGMYQGRSIKLAKSGGLGGRRFIPTVTVLSREAVDDINAKGVKRANWDKPHIKVIKSGEDEVKLLISQLLLDAIVGSQRGRTQAGPSKGASIKGTGITSDETKELSGEFKKLVKVLNSGKKLAKTGDYYLLDIPIKYNDGLNRYEMPLPDEVAESIIKEALTTLFQHTKEELNEYLDDLKYGEEEFSEDSFEQYLKEKGYKDELFNAIKNWISTSDDEAYRDLIRLSRSVYDDMVKKFREEDARLVYKYLDKLIELMYTNAFTYLQASKEKPIRENYEILDQYLSVIDSNDMDEDTAYAYLEDQGLDSSQINSIINYAFPQKADKDIPFQGMTEEEQKLRSLIQQIIKEELSEVIDPNNFELGQEDPENAPMGVNDKKSSKPMIGSVSIKSTLEKISSKVFAEKDLNKAKEIFRSHIENSNIKDKDKKTILRNIDMIKTKDKLNFYLANSLLHYEGSGLGQLKEELEENLSMTYKGDTIYKDNKEYKVIDADNFSVTLEPAEGGEAFKTTHKDIKANYIKFKLDKDLYAKSFLDDIKPAGLDINADPKSSEFTDLEDAAYHFIKSTDIEGLRPEELVFAARAYAKK